MPQAHEQPHAVSPCNNCEAAYDADDETSDDSSSDDTGAIPTYAPEHLACDDIYTYRSDASSSGVSTANPDAEPVSAASHRSQSQSRGSNAEHESSESSASDHLGQLGEHGSSADEMLPPRPLGGKSSPVRLVIDEVAVADFSPQLRREVMAWLTARTGDLQAFIHRHENGAEGLDPGHAAWYDVQFKSFAFLAQIAALEAENADLRAKVPVSDTETEESDDDSNDDESDDGADSGEDVDSGYGANSADDDDSDDDADSADDDDSDDTSGFDMDASTDDDVDAEPPHLPDRDPNSDPSTTANMNSVPNSDTPVYPTNHHLLKEISHLTSQAGSWTEAVSDRNEPREKKNHDQTHDFWATVLNLTPSPTHGSQPSVTNSLDDARTTSSYHHAHPRMAEGNYSTTTASTTNSLTEAPRTPSESYPYQNRAAWGWQQQPQTPSQTPSHLQLPQPREEDAGQEEDEDDDDDKDEDDEENEDEDKSESEPSPCTNRGRKLDIELEAAAAAAAAGQGEDGRLLVGEKSSATATAATSKGKIMDKVMGKVMDKVMDEVMGDGNGKVTGDGNGNGRRKRARSTGSGYENTRTPVKSLGSRGSKRRRTDYI